MKSTNSATNRTIENYFPATKGNRNLVSPPFSLLSSFLTFSLYSSHYPTLSSPSYASPRHEMTRTYLSWESVEQIPADEAATIAKGTYHRLSASVMLNVE